MTFSNLASIAALAALLIVFLSPVAAQRLAAAHEAVARSLRTHGGAMEAAYAAYRGAQRMEGRRDARTQAAAVHDAA